MSFHQASALISLIITVFSSSCLCRRQTFILACNNCSDMAGKLCERMKLMAWTSVSRVGAAMLTIALLSVYFPPFLLFRVLHPPGTFFLLPLLKAPSGGFGYAGLQSSSQTQYSYSLSQGSRAKTQSPEVNEALYSLDRVLHGKSSTFMHEGSGCICHVSKMQPSLSVAVFDMGSCPGWH